MNRLHSTNHTRMPLLAARTPCSTPSTAPPTSPSPPCPPVTCTTSSGRKACKFVARGEARLGVRHPGTGPEDPCTLKACDCRASRNSVDEGHSTSRQESRQRHSHLRAQSINNIADVLPRGSSGCDLLPHLLGLCIARLSKLQQSTHRMALSREASAVGAWCLP